MTRRIVALLALALPLVLTACKTPEQKLVDRRRELRASLDRVYADYAARPEGAQPEGEAGVLGRITGEVDRAYFERQCLAAGRGERTIALTAKLDAFLKEERHARACREAADLDAEVSALERQVNGAR
jgi:hypothetical protein